MNVTLVDCLRLLGLEPLYTQDPDPYIQEEYEKHSWKKKILNYVYPLSIALIMIFHVILVFHSTIVSEERENMALVFFLMNQPIQYGVAYGYFHGQSVKRMYESKAENRNVEKKERWRCLPGEHTLFKLWLSVSSVGILFFLICLYILPLVDDASFLRHLDPVWLSFGGVFIPLSILYGKAVMILITFVFFFSFFQQLQKIQSLRTKIQKREWRQNNKKTSVAQLCYRIIDCRYTLMRMIRKLESVYVYSTLLGGIGVGIMIQYKTLTLPLLAEALQFFLTQIIFLIVIYQLGEEREELLRIVRHRDFATSYILRRNEFCQTCLDLEKHKESTMPRTSSDTMMYPEHTHTEVDDSKEMEDSLDRIHREVFVTHPSRELMSIPVLDVVVEHPPGDEHVSPYRKRTLGEEEEEKEEDVQKKIQDLLESTKTFGKMPYQLDKTGCTLSESEFIRCIYEWVSNTGSTTDWLVLNTLLNEEWASFSLFGVQLSDAGALEKAMGITTVLVSLSSQVGDLSWLF